jgi:hypothetical protein
MPQPDLFTGTQPGSVFDHFVEVLLFGEPVATTGGKHRREWRLGNRDIDEAGQQLRGHIGWQRAGQRTADHYNRQSRRWEDVVEDADVSARAPFLFDGSTRVLAVLKHPTFRERTIPDIFERILRSGENARQSPSTEWSVEPILDEMEFRQWLRSVDSVSSINLVAKLPNPDALPEFEEVWAYMESKRAKLLREWMEAANPEVGLLNLDEDQKIGQYLALGRDGFGYVKASGRREGRDVQYDQRDLSVRERAEQLPSSWAEVFGILGQAIRRRRGRET